MIVQPSTHSPEKQATKEGSHGGGDESKARRRGGPARALFFSAALALLVCMRSLLVSVSRPKGGSGYSYDPASVVLVTELLKLALAAGMLAWTRRGLGARGMVKSVVAEADGRVAALYAIPALLYAVQNVIVFYALLCIDAPTFELFSNLKIVTTAVLFRVVMKRRLTRVQWVAIVLMTIGTALGQLGAQRQHHRGEEARRAEAEAAGAGWSPSGASPGAGLALCAVYAVLSASAGIFTERLLKGSRQSSHLQNLEIYAWSVAVNVAGTLAVRGTALPAGGLTAGFTALTWAIAVNGALMGQCVSFVMLYADNVVKVFAACVALFMSTLLSSLFASFEPPPLLFFGFGVCSCALFLYFGPHNEVLARAAREADQRRHGRQAQAQQPPV